MAIFHKVAMVGLDSPRSIWPNIALLTPVFNAALLKLQPKILRCILRFLAISGWVIMFFKKYLCVITYDVRVVLVRYNIR